METKIKGFITISSSVGRRRSEPDGTHYTVSRAGLLNLTRHTAREHGRYDVNPVCPGLEEIPMIREEARQESRNHRLRQKF